MDQSCWRGPQVPEESVAKRQRRMTKLAEYRVLPAGGYPSRRSVTGKGRSAGTPSSHRRRLPEAWASLFGATPVAIVVESSAINNEAIIRSAVSSADRLA